MALFDYLKMLEGMMRDRNERLLNTDDLIAYLNTARRDIALRTQCIRCLPPISGAIKSINVTAPGSGYTNPMVFIPSPDFPSGNPTNPNGAQAVASAQQIGGMISDISLNFGGAGYFQPLIQITDPTGSGAAATATIQPIVTLNQGQEVYNFADVPLDTFPGVGSIYTVLSVAVIFNNYRYPLLERPFTYYQAYVRAYPDQYEYVPFIYSQYGQGAAGSLYMYPLPNQTYQLELDCLCLPSDLENDEDFEAIPDPWRDAVPFYAAHLAALELQNGNKARMWLELYRDRVNAYSSGARPRLTILGRW